MQQFRDDIQDKDEKIEQLQGKVDLLSQENASVREQSEKFSTKLNHI
jgi:uncharacterized protein YoxC